MEEENELVADSLGESYKASTNITNNSTKFTVAIDDEYIAKKSVYFYLKSMIGRLMATIGLILLAPFFIAITLLIKSEDKGPVFYSHERIGLNGKKFKLYKFRTMFVNSKEMMENFTKEQKEEYEKNFKLKDDPRITKMGNILRKTSLDELPQLLNIIKGEMCVIGPRPIVDAELEKFGNEKAQEKLLSVLPGLTGNWAANGRSDTTYEERVKLELDYVDQISLKKDMQIFIKTILIVLKRNGAM